MSKHIDWTMINSESEIDREHLAVCGECARAYRYFAFLKLQTQGASAVEPPPFFAEKMANLTRQTVSPLWFHFQWVAARLAPALALLILATGLLIVNVLQRDLSDPTVLDDATAEMSFENMIGSLHEVPKDAGGAR